MEPVATPRLHQALLMAAQWHLGQDREGESPLPYLTHPIEVLVNLRHVGGVTDEDLLCAAALHDVVEESNADLGEIERALGGRVAALVQELTRREPGPKETAGMTKEQIWELRSSLLLGEIGAMSADAQKVKLADRLSNLREGIRTKRGKKLERYLRQTETILKIVPRNVNPGLWDAIAELAKKGA